MVDLFSLISRNFKLFIRDRSAVFFAFLAGIILFVVYILFLGQIMPGWVPDGYAIPHIDQIVDAQVMAGIIIINGVTITLTMFSRMITDETEKKINGLLVAPIHRFKIIIAYLFSAWVAGILLSIIMLVIAQFYLVSQGGQFLSTINQLKAMGIIVLNVVSASAVTFFLASLVHSESAFSTLNALVGTLIGFIAGVYVPLSVLGKGIETFAKFIPFTYNATLMRQVMTEETMKKITEEAPQAVAPLEHAYGMANIDLFGLTMTVPFILGFLTVSTALFLGLTYMKLKNRKI